MRVVSVLLAALLGTAAARGSAKKRKERAAEKAPPPPPPPPSFTRPASPSNEPWTSAGDESVVASHDYCIVGAGPGGLQLGHYMYLAGRDYMIFDRQVQPGAFFDRFPIHRTLISMNKRHTGRDNAEFNRRHDWNSLLDNDEVPSIPSRTPKRWPDADILAQYLREFARTQEDAGRIQYATSVDQVRRDSKTGEFMMDVEPSALDGESAPWYFDKEYRHEDSRRNTKGLRGVVKCGKLVMACGLWEPNVLPMVGIDLAEGYETLPESGAKFEGKTIAIMGMGNSAFEAAKSFDDYTNFVHIWPTRGKPPWPWVSWESRYSGSLRANTAGSLDGYLLDTLDALGLSDYVVANPKRMMIVKCLGDQLCLFNRNTNPDTGDHVALLGYYDPASPFQAAFVANMTNMGLTAVINREVSINQNRVARVTTDAEAGISVDDSKLKIPARNIVVFADNITEDNVDLIMEYRHHTGDNLASPYDHIIRATGWRHNTSLYHPSAAPLLQVNHKYPQLTTEYESVNVPGMYFAGTLTHGKDFKRGPGSDIKGFRYSARALHRILSEKFHGEDLWNTKTYCLPKQHAEFAAHMLERINEAAAPYVFPQTLGDGVLFAMGDGSDDSCKLVASYKEEQPIDYFTEQYGSQHRLWWSFGYDGQNRKLSETLAHGTGFEPWVWFWQPGREREGISGTAPSMSKQLLRIDENLFTDFSNDHAAKMLSEWCVRARSNTRRWRLNPNSTQRDALKHAHTKYSPMPRCLHAQLQLPASHSRTHAHAQEVPHYSLKNCSVGSQAARHGRHNALRWRFSEAPERDGPGALHRHRPQGRRAEDLPAFDIPVRCFFVFSSSFPSSHVGMPGKTVSTAPLAAPTVPHELTRASSVSVCVL
jgi:thioredoxin reductase